MKKLIAAVVVLGALCVVPAASEAGLIRHSGSSNPAATDGYLSEAGNQFWISSYSNCSANGINDGGTLCWQIYATAANGVGNPYIVPTAADRAEGNANGWVLTTTLRLPTTSDANDAGVNVYYGDGVTFWSMTFGTEADGDPTVTACGSAYAIQGVGNTAYHTFKLVYDPVAKNVDLFVDGVERLSNLSGFAHTWTAVCFGDTTSTSGINGTGNYNLVEWYTVPEPASVAFMGMGLAAVFALRRKR